MSIRHCAIQNEQSSWGRDLNEDPVEATRSYRWYVEFGRDGVANDDEQTHEEASSLFTVSYTVQLTAADGACWMIRVETPMNRLRTPSSFYSLCIRIHVYDHQLQRIPESVILAGRSRGLGLDTGFDDIQRTGDETGQRPSKETAHEECGVVLWVRENSKPHLISRGIQNTLHPVICHDEHGGIGHVHENGREVRRVERAHSLLFDDGAESNEGTRVQAQLHSLLHHVQRRHHRIVRQRSEGSGNGRGVHAQCRMKEYSEIRNTGYSYCSCRPDTLWWIRIWRSTRRGRECTHTGWDSCPSRALALRCVVRML